ncbi:NADP-dependent oxidoreductase [Afipia massiliensis]|uniref:NADP-dependent oxidoreductase n=1 Tax=Afipia massiliensis TaxID=211460 RepID=A0A4U6BSZ9_9BRAD|nr:NADP-dependent oxidoreductase [Afipia massiliensis]TKT72148.1 NADP-dependent oxidoreductase [Afipia massiliensis]
MSRTELNRQLHLVRRPAEKITPLDFRLVEAPVVNPGEGQILVRQKWLSIDPYLRERMNDAKSYLPPQPLDEVMAGGGAGEVVQSKHPEIAVGDQVIGLGGWQLFATMNGAAVARADTAQAPLAAFLGAAGMPGITAWYGLRKIIAPKGGETIVVSAASGSVGGVAGQLAKLSGCRVVGIAGGDIKCRYVVDELGFDACVDHRAGDFDAQLAAATPAGIDGCFENVGGVVLDAVMRRLNPFARVAVSGLISGGYDGQPVPIADANMFSTARVRMEGFIVSDHRELWPEARAELAGLIASKRLKYRESIATGLESAPGALIDVLEGRNFGKQLVELP